MAQASGYSRTHIALHWVTAVIIVGQFVFGETMVKAFDTSLQGGIPDMTPVVWGHIIGGMAVLLLVMWRLQIRVARGVPALPAGTPIWLVLGSRLGHLALYALLFVVPMSGIVAWFGRNETAGDVHSWLRIVLFFLIAGHILAALYHGFIRRDGVLRRMVRVGP